MTQNLPPPFPSLLPESAPFTPSQRAWLNGFFSGFLGLDANGITALSAEQNAAVIAGVPARGAPPDDDDDTPWHDQTLPIDERMKLSEGRALRHRLMAAMAQQDCGQCGYDCARYSAAIFEKKEERLNLCVPGGKETARMVKKLYEEIGAAATAALPASVASSAPATAAITTSVPAPVPGTSRDAPAQASFRSRLRLNKNGSAKETYHVEIDLAGSGIRYEVGDAFGLFPRNDGALVEEVMRFIGAPPDHPIGSYTLRHVLTERVSLSPAPDSLFQLISYITGGDRRQKAKLLAAGEDPDGDAADLDVLAALQKFPGLKTDPEALIEALEPIQPRLYSISSSPKMLDNAVALTVDTVRYAIKGRQRHGVASTFLAERVKPGDTFGAYVQKASHFSLPSDPATPIIMIGPGTGVAPFRAFLHERMATGASGRNWLFFGHQRRDTDFFYEDELLDLKAKNVLTRLALAWSRDTDEKFYVQDRMRQVGRDLWAWLADGAHIYVCGDAKRMAKDVERTLVDIVGQHGVRTLDEAVAFVGNLKKQGRYHQDVY
jgi:sulfite reductase (NADPH) flavoprotein alpha-component